MILAVKVTTGAKKTSFIPGAEVARASVTAPPVDGKANAAVISLVADHYGVRESAVEIIKGLKSRNKVISIRL
jgi:uncharacterized protein (TIGR00251 family)